MDDFSTILFYEFCVGFVLVQHLVEEFCLSCLGFCTECVEEGEFEEFSHQCGSVYFLPEYN